MMTTEQEISRKQVAPPQVSVIIPVGDRYDDLDGLCAGLRQTLTPLAGAHEVIFINDGGGADVRQALSKVAERYPEARILRFQRRVGEATALAIGAQWARGDTIVTLDPYLHIPLAELPKLFAPLRDGADLVSAWRFPRTETGLGRLASEWFNAAARRLTKVPVHDLNCRMRVMRREVLQDLPLYGDLHRFLPIFAARRGWRWQEVQVPQQPGKREIGAFDATSYMDRLLDLLTLAFLTRFVKRPLHFFGLVGLTSFAVGAAIALVLLYQRLVLGLGVGHRPLLLLAVLLIVMGIQIGSIGLLGEVMIFTHARDVTDYVVQEEQ
jgi:glycosyltransferase involved in cell wall biosynthesis